MSVNQIPGYSEQEYLETVRDMISKMKFGQVTIIVQDGRVIQIEQTNKIRIKN